MLSSLKVASRVPSGLKATPNNSPDGKQLASSNFSNGDNSIAAVSAADGSDQTNLTRNPASDDNPAWSPDGSRIAFTSDRDSNQEIYVMNADGSNPFNLTKNPAEDDNPSWSAAGKQIVFSSDRNGNNEIYSMNADGSNVTNLTKNAAFDVNAAWSPK